MIMRVFRCSVVADKQAEFREYAFTKSHPWLRQQPGLLAFYAARPLPGSDDRNRCMVQIWKDAEALQSVFGDDWRKPPKLPDEVRQFIDWASVEHYELADEFRVQN